MKKFIFISALSLATMTTHSIESTKQQAYAAIRDFFQLTDQTLILKGRYIETPTEYGKTCQIVIDFTQPGQEYIAVSGEYTPVTMSGDGIYFNADGGSFTYFAQQHDRLIIEQKLSDSFSTWTKTTLQLSKKVNQVEVILQQTNSFLFFTDSVEKRCSSTLNKKPESTESIN